MKRPKISLRHRLFGLWLIACACQCPELFSQYNAYDTEGYAPSPSSWTENSYDPYSYYPSNEFYDPYVGHPLTEPNIPQNGPWPAYANSQPSISTGESYPNPSFASTSFDERPLSFEQSYGEILPSTEKAPPDLSKEALSSYSAYLAFQPESSINENSKPTIDQTAPAVQPAKEKHEIKIVKRTKEDTSKQDTASSAESKSIKKADSTTPSHTANTTSAQLSDLADFIAQVSPADESVNEAAPQQQIAQPLPRENNLPAPTAEDVRSEPAARTAQQTQAPTPTPAPTVPAAPRPPMIITPTSPGPSDPAASRTANAKHLKEISINFNNVSMIEYIRFISRISNKNFIFDEENLQFNVTIVSEEPTTVENLMAALLQELKIRDLSLLEQGNNIIIHRNPRVRAPARIVADGTEQDSTRDSELVTRVFRLNTLDPVKASEIIRPLLSDDALVEVLRDTNNLIITDLVTTVNKISQLINTLDAPNSGVTIGQYVVRNAFVDSLVDLGTKILQPIAQGNPFVLVPHPVSNSIFIVSNSFIVEKALAILQNLDLNEGRTKILSLDGLQPAYETTPAGRPGTVGRGPGTPGFPGAPGEVPGVTYPMGPEGIGPEGFGPGGVGVGGAAPGTLPGAGPEGFGPGGQFPSREGVPESFPLGGIGVEGRPFSPQAPSGTEGYPFTPGGIGIEGRPSAIFGEGRTFAPGGIGAATRWSRELPLGHIERTLFFIYKLRYRRGDQIEIALRKIANSLQLTGTANADLISAINSSQWIESSNALIFTGTATALEKVRELILEVDIPLRQVFIEMLILETTITDSLSYGVDWINRFGGGPSTGEQGFLGVGNLGFNNASNIPIHPVEGDFPLFGGATSDTPTFNIFSEASSLGAYTAGVIGTHLTHHGTRFSTIGALVRAIHTDIKSNILLNPKIITEDNNTAEIFVGGTDRYKTQSITNDLGSLVTNNFQFIDVGTTLRVTPLIGNNGIVTLDIIQETTAPSGFSNDSNFSRQDVNLVEVLTKSRSVTKVHVPDGFFIVLSGMIRDQETRSYSRVPCLGGIPIIGALNKRQTNSDDKRNLMLFIRPLIIDTSEDLEDITRRQQDVYNEKTKFRRSWNYEIDEGLNFLNIKPTDRDEIGCDE